MARVATLDHALTLHLHMQWESSHLQRRQMHESIMRVTLMASTIANELSLGKPQYIYALASAALLIGDWP